MPTQPPTYAETRARLAQMWDRVHPDPDGPPLVIQRLVNEAATAAGFTVWLVGGPNGSTVVLPSLDPEAPLSIRRRYRSRVIASASGRCPTCEAVAGVSGPDPEHGRAAFRLLSVTIRVPHSPGCPAIFGEADRRWFPVARP